MYPITIAVAGYAEVSAEILDLAREHAFALGESTVCINSEYTLANLDPELQSGAGAQLRELLTHANRMGICDLVLSE